MKTRFAKVLALLLTAVWGVALVADAAVLTSGGLKERLKNRATGFTGQDIIDLVDTLAVTDTLVSVETGKGASTIGLEDAAARYTAATVEAALAEARTANATAFIPLWDSACQNGSAAPAVAAAITGNTRFVARAFDGASNEDVTCVWQVPHDFSGTTVTARVVGFVSAATAPAVGEIVAFSVALACAGNSELGTTAVGTAQTTSLTAVAGYAQHDRLATNYSSAITPAGTVAAGDTCAAALIRLAATTDTYVQDFAVLGLEIKYARIFNNN